MMRTDANNNPTAFTTDIAAQAGLKLGEDYVQGDPFKEGSATLYTAKLLGDPILTTERVISAIGFYAHSGGQRWTYIGLPKFLWDAIDPIKGLVLPSQRDVIGFMYQREGGVEMRGLFPNYGKP